MALHGPRKAMTSVRFTHSAPSPYSSMERIDTSEVSDTGSIPVRGSIYNQKKIMASFFREGNRLSFNGFKGTIIKITETYRKNVLVLKVSEYPRRGQFLDRKVETIGIFEYPDGTLEFMSIID